MSDANTSAAAHQDELLLVAEKLGELSDRFARIESEFTAQTAPIETSKANLDATVAALNAVLTGIKAIDSHVLSNDLGSVSKRVEQVELSAKKPATSRSPGA
jgi:nitrogen fixation/metabolism regulation signal transduction histidine kinase